jgi:hypothetical protein
MVYYSTDTIDLRANWDINQQLKIPPEIFPISQIDSIKILKK